MNIGNITSDNFNLDGNGKDIQIEVYEQLIEQLQQENKILRENAENNDKVVDKVNWENMLLKKENKQLKDNWNKLKEWVDKCYDYYKESDDYYDYFTEGVCLQDGDYNELEDILKEVSE